MSDLLSIKFSSTHTALAARVQDSGDLPQVARELGLPSPRPVLVLVGGASGMTEAVLARLRPLFDEALAPAAEKLGAVVIDGGTDEGVMRLMGQARVNQTCRFPLIGLVAEQLVAWPNQPPKENQVRLEPHHTHFVLLPGAEWGEESEWIGRLAGVLAGPLPSLTVLINGGEIAYEDVRQSIRHNRPVIVVDDSGRTANRLAAAVRGDPADRRSSELAASGLLTVIGLKEHPVALSAAVQNLMQKE